MLSIMVLAAVCLVISGGSLLAGRHGGAQDREAWPLLTGIAALGAVGLGFAALWRVRLWRGRRQRFLVLSPDGVESPGFTGTLRWLDLRAVSASGSQAHILFLLRPGVPLPPRTGRIWRLHHVARQHGIQFVGMLPRGLPAAALQTMLLQRAQAAHARNRLQPPSA